MTEETDKEASADYEGNGQKRIEVTPMQLLKIILKVALKDRATDEEIDRICTVYYKAIEDLWGNGE